MSVQLALRPTDWRAVYDEWLRLLRTVVEQLGVKQVAYELDEAPSALLHALAGRERHHVKAAWIPYLVAHAPNDEPLEYLAALRGLELTEPDPVTPADELRALKETLADQLGPDLMRTISAKAGIRARRRK